MQSRQLRAARLAAFTFAVLASVALASCASGRSTAPRTGDTVLLVSIDGFRADYLDRGLTPNLSRIASEGVRAEWMNPSYPTLTFPNHYTLVTGRRPDRHGIVHNTMRDEVLGGFKLSSEAVEDARWWNGGVPVWVTAERAGLRTATMFWPGSEAAIHGVRPTRWMPYDDAMPSEQRVDTVLDWLDVPASERPRFATLYFSELDHAGHDQGPDAPETHAAIRSVDAAIGRLMTGLQARGLDDDVNLIVVSDHGMAPVPVGQQIVIEDMVYPADAEPVTGGEVLGFVPKPGREAMAEQRLLGRHPHHACWRKEQLPAKWRYGTHARIPPIVCQTDVGWEAIPRARLAQRLKRGTRGAHGFAPEAPQMRALFVAHGPAFRSGVRLPAFDNVDVYSLLARLVGVNAEANDVDGDMRSLAPSLRDSTAQ